MPCSPSLYHHTSGAITGFGFYMVDRTYESFENLKPPDSELFSLCADLDRDGPLDLLTGGVIYRGQNDSVFILDNFQITNPDPPYCTAVDYNGDDDLDLFTGQWFTNTLDASPSDPSFIVDPAKVTPSTFLNTKTCAFAPMDVKADGLPEEDLDIR